MSFCAVTHLFQLSVCAQTIWHGSPARQRAVLSRGKIINHNLDGEGVRDRFDFSSRADSSTGSSSEKVSRQPLRAAGWTCEGNEARKPDLEPVAGRRQEQSSSEAHPLQSLPAGLPGGCGAAKSLAVLRSSFFSASGLQTVVLGTELTSLGSAPFCRAWPL